MAIDGNQKKKNHDAASRPPEWIRGKWVTAEASNETRELTREFGLHTVCESARCPNRGECWRRRTATFMVMGDICTRNCKFCGVGKGAPVQLDPAEPENVAKAIDKLDLAHAVITSVTRDDLADGGAAHFAATVAAIRSIRPATKVEALVPDFLGNPDSIAVMLDAEPDVFAHNVEMVERLYPAMRSARHSYRRSLDVLRIAAERAACNNGRPIIKSGLMVGLGETDEEIEATLRDLLIAGCQTVSIGQYLRPSPDQCEVVRYVEPKRFEDYENMAREMGFVHAMAGPFVRSSYHSDEVWKALEHSPTSALRE